jgi:hypothetical protein
MSLRALQWVVFQSSADSDDRSISGSYWAGAVAVITYYILVGTGKTTRSRVAKMTSAGELRKSLR